MELSKPVKKKLEWDRVFNTTNHLINFEIQRNYQNESKFNGLYSRKKLPKKKDGAYVINLDKDKTFGTRLVAIYDDFDNFDILIILVQIIFLNRLKSLKIIKL